MPSDACGGGLRCPRQTRPAEMTRARLFAIACGYEYCDDLDILMLLTLIAASFKGTPT